MNALELQGLTKHYKDFTLGPLDLTLPGGTICGLIGENGAGKSTTIKLILDMLQRDGGTVTILSRDNRTDLVHTKEEIGVVLGSEGIPLCLNAVQAGKVHRHHRAHSQPGSPAPGRSAAARQAGKHRGDRKSTRLNSSHT